MLSKAEIKYINSLNIKKYRQIFKTYIVEGVKLIDEYIKNDLPIDRIYATPSWILQRDEIISSESLNITEITEIELSKISQLTTPNEVVAIVKQPDCDINQINIGKGLTLVLEDVSDPGNLGTIIRIADWFGIENIICSEESVDVYNPKVVQATMGSIVRVNVVYTGLKEFFIKQNNIDIYGTVLNGESIYSKELKSSGIILMGNESRGISNELMPYITEKISIPLVKTPSKSSFPESLNLSVATGIICSEFRRKGK
ncbi:MAG: RNA methyltransferase [Bacteroidota bacterium]|nr:RNA methyltransferase [Bacteroidota bacterium]